MPWSLDAVEHESYSGFDMDALVICTQANPNVVMVWAWIIWSSSKVEHERRDGLGMDALVVGRSRT